MAEGATVATRDLPEEILDTANEYPRPPDADNGVVWSLTFMEARRRHLNQFEAAYLRNLLERCTGNISRAAEAADVDRKTFYRLLRKHNLQRPLLQDRSGRSEQVGRHAAVE
jgi:transcriptional regulator of acetoin/glycerol metabolism